MFDLYGWFQLKDERWLRTEPGISQWMQSLLQECHSAAAHLKDDGANGATAFDTIVYGEDTERTKATRGPDTDTEEPENETAARD